MSRLATQDGWDYLTRSHDAREYRYHESLSEAVYAADFALVCDECGKDAAFDDATLLIHRNVPAHTAYVGRYHMAKCLPMVAERMA